MSSDFKKIFSIRRRQKKRKRQERKTISVYIYTQKRKHQCVITFIAKYRRTTLNYTCLFRYLTQQEINKPKNTQLQFNLINF